MFANHFERVIAQWCAASGLEPWKAGEDIHMDIDGCVVGIASLPVAPDVLQVYVDLGATAQDADAARALMRENFSTDGAGGFFAWHPEGRLIYRVQVPLDENASGDGLAALLREAVRLGRVRQAT